MRRFYFIFYVFLISLLFVADGLSQSARIGSSVDSLRVGQVFEMFIILEGGNEFNEVAFPDSSAFPSELEFQSINPLLTDSGADSIVYRFQFFGSEDILVTGLSIELIRDIDQVELPLPDYPLYFRATLSDDELRPLKPLFDFAGPLWPWILLALLIILLAVLGYYGFKKYQNRPLPQPEPEPIEPPPPFKDPLSELESSIRRLNEQAETIDIERYYVEVTDSIRRYLEDVNKFPALEQTTREVEQNLISRRGASRLTDEIVSILREADMVKFAKFTPERYMVVENLKKAEALIHEFHRTDRMRIEAMRKEYNRIHFPVKETEGNA